MKRATLVTGKEPWLAVVLSTIFPGTGQIYAGKIARGLILIILALGLVSFAGWSILSSSGNAFVGIQGFLGYLLLFIFNLFDAHRCTRKGNHYEFERLESTGWEHVIL